MTLASLDQARAELSARLQQRRTEIEVATLNRIHSVSDPSAFSRVDPGYVDGLRTAVCAALDYGLEAVELGLERLQPVPAALLVQARLAARNSIGLDTVLRRYVAGCTVLGDFIMQEAGTGLADFAVIHRVGREQATLLDRLLAVISDEHSREARSRLGTAVERRVERVQRLLAGEFVELADFEYDFRAEHLGAVATGPGAKEALRSFARSFDCQALLVPRGEGAAWAWFGATHGHNREEIKRRAGVDLPQGVSLAVGEPSQGLAGWRLTHRQARAALPVALRGSQRLVRYSEVALLASVLQDEVFAASLRECYLAPLAGGRDGGVALRETLRAYFSAERNISSTAVVLGVSRRTVGNRLQAIEAKLGQPLGQIAADVEAALRLQELDASWEASGDPVSHIGNCADMSKSSRLAPQIDTRLGGCLW